MPRKKQLSCIYCPVTMCLKIEGFIRNTVISLNRRTVLLFKEITFNLLNVLG